jgi:hypothetical protein
MSTAIVFRDCQSFEHNKFWVFQLWKGTQDVMMDLWADQLAEFRHISIAMVRYIAVFFSTQVMFNGPKDGLA